MSGALGIAGALAVSCSAGAEDPSAERAALAEQGQQVFRFDTFGDETRWIDTLRPHEVIRTAVDPSAALAVDLKVDTAALPAARVGGIQNGSVDLRSPASTSALLELDAVLGLEAKVESVQEVDELARIDITCARCHATVDNSSAPGIGKRLDGMNGPQVIPSAYRPTGIHRITSTGGDDLLRATLPALRVCQTSAATPNHASHSATRQYLVAPLKWLWKHPPHLHNGSAATRDAMVQTCNTKRSLGLRSGQMADLVHHLTSL